MAHGDIATSNPCTIDVTVGGLDAMGHTEVFITGTLGGDSNQTGDLTFRIADQYDLYTDATLQNAVGGQPFNATVAHLMPIEDGPQNYNIGVVSLTTDSKSSIKYFSTSSVKTLSIKIFKRNLLKSFHV